MLKDDILTALASAYDAVLLDVGGTLVAEAPPGTPVTAARSPSRSPASSTR